jgi:FKBP-type peptidyl-prolyl cis-trans isomerase FkpA
MNMNRAIALLLPVLLTSCSSSYTPPDATASKAYLEKAAAAPGAVQTPSGLIYRELRAGTGTSPVATDSVKVNYRGTLIDGKKFDSSENVKFPLNQVIPCWTEGVQKMRVGGKAELVCPASIGYGERGSPPDIPGGATLIFEIELLGIG